MHNVARFFRWLSMVEYESPSATYRPVLKDKISKDYINVRHRHVNNLFVRERKNCSKIKSILELLAQLQAR